MPLYEYICRDCDRGFETLVAASQRDEADACPQCGSTRVARKVSLIGGHISREAGRTGGSSEPFNCGASGCCGGMCQMD